MKLADVLNIADLRQAARRPAYPTVFDYVDDGAYDEKCIVRNASALDDLSSLLIKPATSQTALYSFRDTLVGLNAGWVE